MAIWEDHLLPLLTGKDAGRLGRTCKALRGLVHEHFTGGFGMIKLDELQAALTVLPRARTLVLYEPPNRPWGDANKDAVVQWLREGGRGRHLTSAGLIAWAAAPRFVHAALQAGALPSLKSISANLRDETQRASLTRGLLGAMRGLNVHFAYTENHPEIDSQLAALGLVGQLPALTKLKLEMSLHAEGVVDVEWPPFIPPSLKNLFVRVWELTESLLRALPGILEASGARLERLEVLLPHAFKDVGDGLAEALSYCSPTLRAFLQTNLGGPLSVDEKAVDYEDQMERLRVEWEGVLAALSTCRQLEVLSLRPVEIEPLFPSGTAFSRLTHLEILDHERERPPDAGLMGLWELMASGGLPALAKLSVMLEGRWGGVEEVKTRVAPALQAVAGTLTHLCLAHLCIGKSVDGEKWFSPEADVEFEMGVAVGKLRRLEDLGLSLLGCEGRFYHAFAQGLTASGGGDPLPHQWRVMLPHSTGSGVRHVASLLLPSVREIFTSHCCYHRHALLSIACALRQIGYKHTWAAKWCNGNEMEDILRPLVAPCRLRRVKVNNRGYFRPPWHNVYPL
jgi:hypothetical protein